jgi:ubiquinone/menaquinone biosynthesis C-methylase UbiE
MFFRKLQIKALSYSKKSHFDFFQRRKYDRALYGKTSDPDFCNLKDYQDLLVFAFIEQFVPPRSTILEVGGGDSRILHHYGKTRECWNLDKLEGVGNGLTKIKDGPFRLVRDYIGNFNPNLPSKYFDFVFSLSALEHVPENDPALFNTMLADLRRVTKPGGYNLHLFDVTLRADASYTNLFLPYLFAHTPARTQFVPLPIIANDPDLFTMSETFYQYGWEATTGIPFLEFGRPASCQICW